MLLLIRHAQTSKNKSLPPETWRLDPAGADALDSLRDAWPWQEVANWFSSPEPKALETAAGLTDRPVQSVPELAELQRRWSDDYVGSVGRLFGDTASPAEPGWETGDDALRRFDRALREIVEASEGDVAVVSHGLVISLWAGALRGGSVDHDEWRSLGFPDLLVLRDDSVAAWLSGTDQQISLTRPLQDQSALARAIDQKDE